MFIGLIGGFPNSEQIRYICSYFPGVLRSPQTVEPAGVEGQVPSIRAESWVALERCRP